ncbi:MAG: diacylglycerol kinase family protein [Verrucomicrobiales bacterium]|nr:diacylglycerol kinase family protein [Verrucomicrobiales bacterium]
MNPPDKFLDRWVRRFACAFRGLGWVLSHEPSGRVHAVGAILAAAMGLWLRITALEWAVLALACGSVIGAEALNTAIEKLADRVSTEREEAIRLVKDTAAGGVLAVTLGAVGTGLGIFGPRLWTMIWE